MVNRNGSGLGLTVIVVPCDEDGKEIGAVKVGVGRRYWGWEIKIGIAWVMVLTVGEKRGC